MKRRILYLSLLLAAVCFVSNAQSDHYYYYNGEKVFLELDTQNIFMTSPNETDVTESESNLFKSSSEVNVDRTYTYLEKIDGKEENPRDFFWKKVELQSLSEVDYQKALEALRKQNPNLIVAPNFKTQDGRKLGMSNYMFVELKSMTDLDKLKLSAQENGLELIGQVENMPLWYMLSVDANTCNAMDMANQFYESGLFSHAQPDLIMEKPLQSAPNDEYYGYQWGLKNTGQFNGVFEMDIRAEDAWPLVNLNNLGNITVAVIDDGVERPHEDLNIHSGYDAFNETMGSGMYTVAQGGQSIRGQHGTAVAGIIGAYKDNSNNNNLGGVGVAPGVKIYPISINDGSSTPSRVVQIIRAMIWAYDQADADVILSLIHI